MKVRQGVGGVGGVKPPLKKFSRKKSERGDQKSKYTPRFFAQANVFQICVSNFFQTMYFLTQI
jgi:hypothetical protein